MKNFKSLSIKIKLNLIILIVSSTSLLIASIIFIIIDRETFKESMKNELSILGNIIGDRSSAAILFDDKRMVKDILVSLKAKTTIINAAVYSTNGQLFAIYNRFQKSTKQSQTSLPKAVLNYNSELAKQQNSQQIKHYQFSTQFLEVWEPIFQSGECIGLIYLKSDMSELNTRLNNFIVSILSAYFLSLFIAFLMAMRLQKIISDPISNLLQTTSLISREKDYSIRASSYTNDELGQLINRFNEMLAQIQSRDLALQEMNLHLEQRVDERTQELTQSNQQLIKAKVLADSASKAKSEFLANMSHEIRTPMNGVLTTTELMLSEEMSNKSRHYLNIINSSAVSLLGIINDILDFSKIEAGKLSIENSHFYICHLFDRLTDIFINKFLEKKIELLFDIDPKTPIHLYGDSLRIQQVLTNLIANSLKFTPENGNIICGTKVLATTADQVQLTFFVKDSGIGIEASKIETLFSAFTQADSTTTRKYGGTGLGLTICKNLVELMGGTIKAQSEPDKGSYFHFDLTLDIDSEEIRKQEKTLFSLPQNMKNLHILLVDDHSDSLQIGMTLLESFGFKVSLSSSGKEALKLLQNNPEYDYDLILLDWNMPELNGLETAHLIRQKVNFKKSIILISTFEKDKQREAVSKELIDAFLQKPLRQSVLFDTIIQLYNDNYHTENKLTVNNKKSIYTKYIHGNRLLVAEDNIINQQVILAVFDKIDVSIKLVNNGKEALDALQQQSFDVVFMDMQMPVMDGYEAIQKIRAMPEFHSLPVIALTAHAMEGDEERCLAAGCNDYITKPINQDYLFKVLARFLYSKKTFKNDYGKEIQSSDMEDHSARFLDKEGELLDVIPGLNIYEAIRQLNISKSQLKKILLQFFSHYKNKAHQMSQRIEKNQWQLLKNDAHDLKGSSANIGAFKLQKKALQLELSCREPVNTARLKKSFNELLSALEQLLEAIKSFAPKTSRNKNKQVTLTHSEKTIKVDKNKAIDTINELHEALENGRPVEIKELFTLLMKQIEHPKLAILESQIKAFDFEEAIETLDSITEYVQEADLN